MDEDRAVVGAANRAYVFDALTGQELHKLKPAESEGASNLGYSVAISGDKTLIGAPGGPESAYLFDVTTGEELHRLVPAGAVPNVGVFGQSVAMNENRAIVGATPPANSVPTLARYSCLMRWLVSSCSN
jgi:hypothetical protein